MVATSVFFGLWPIQFDELNKLLLTVQIQNFLCAFHVIRIVMEVINIFPSAL